MCILCKCFLKFSRAIFRVLNLKNVTVTRLKSYADVSCPSLHYIINAMNNNLLLRVLV